MIARSRTYHLITTRALPQCSATCITYRTLAHAGSQNAQVGTRRFSAKANNGTNYKGFTNPDFSTMGFETVLVRVGKPSVDILVYRDLVCSVSSFFRGSIDRSFLGVKEGTITLRDVSEATFRTFLAWCHWQCLPGSTPNGLLVSPKHLKNHQNADDKVVITKSLAMNGNANGNGNGNGRPRTRIFDEYVAGKSPLLRSIGAEQLDKLFHGNPVWQATYQEVVKALVRLYIFADRYNVPQLRDDIMSTYIGYCISHGLYPDPDDVEVIDLAYTKLPPTALLSRYLVLSTIYFWTPIKLTLESGKLERLHSGFTLDVMTAQAQRGQPPEEGETDSTKVVPQLAKYGLKNSCVFHEHQTRSSESCRHRLAHSKFIFDGLLEACVKEAESILAKAI